MKKLKTKINFNKLRNKKDKMKAKLRNQKEKKVKVKKEKKVNNKEKKKNSIGYWILIAITTLAIIFILTAAFFGLYIIYTAPKFDPNLLYEKEASVIYDSDGNIIATLGVAVGNEIVEKREILSYEELPQVLVDAIVATEDSRFFQHNGFDLPRFLKASVGQLLGNSDAGGGSTLTMQVVKNNFTGSVAEGVKGIIRKFTDIYMSIFKVEKNYTKEEIIEYYVNGPFLGSGAYGVEQASLIYFGKHASELSLPEAATIAGLFQAPTAYDPYVYPEQAQARRNIVLNLMLRHGYINEEECEIAKSMDIKNMLVSEENSEINEYQGFIDTVIKEVEQKTKSNPYNVPMEIYTTMKKSKQDVINDFYDGTLGYEFKDDLIQVGISVIDNKTGAIIAVGAGRNKTRVLGLNYATEIKRHPGSTAKPLFDYGPGVEYLKWSTYTPFFDEPTSYSSGQAMNNWDGQFLGLLTMKQALVKSRNTNALQAFKTLDNNLIYDFVTSLGVTPETSDGYVNEAHAVGAFEGVSPTVLAGAYSAFASGGYYTKPYTVTKVVYRETGDVFEPKVSRTRVMSEETAYIITNSLYGVTPSSTRVSGTQIATKTGTSSYDAALLRQLGISNAIQDSWVATYSPDYTLSFWYGYDELYTEHYNTMGASTTQRNIIQGKLCNNIFERNSIFTIPSSVSAVKVELETIPAQKPSEFTPENLIETHYFIRGTEPSEVSTRFSKLENPKNVKIAENNNSVNISWNYPDIPSAVSEEYLTDYFNNGYGEWANKYYTLRLQYNDANIGTYGFDIYLKDGENLKYIGFTTENNYTVRNISGYDAVVVKSTYSIFKANSSDGVEKSLSGLESSLSIELMAIEGSNKIHPTIKTNSTLPDLGVDTIKVLLNNVDITDSVKEEDISIIVTNRISSSEVSNGLAGIDLTKAGWYQIVYQVNYLGQIYTSETRSLYIE